MSSQNGDDEIRTHDPRLARAVLSQLSYVPETRFAGNPKYEYRNTKYLEFRISCFGFPWASGQRQWAREDLNFRPHAYQACALAS